MRNLNPSNLSLNKKNVLPKCLIFGEERAGVE